MNTVSFGKNPASRSRAVTEEDLQQGADNLLKNCLSLEKGQELLIINENSPWVEKEICALYESMAKKLGAKVHVLWTDRIPGPEQLPTCVVKAFENAEKTLFNHQIGGMLRLLPIGGSGLKVFNFATTAAILGSKFCKSPYGLWLEVLKALQLKLNHVQTWQMTSPYGTDLKAKTTENERNPKQTSEGFSLRTFPIGTHKPFSMQNAHGALAIRWLTPSGIHQFEPAGIRLDETVVATIEGGKITDFDGPKREVHKLKDYLEEIGRKTQKDPYIVNSWHAGIHPLAYSPYADTDGLEPWMFIAHNNPRIAHFHVVGEVMPGEMSAPVIDPTVIADGEVYWKNGELLFLNTPEMLALAAKYGCTDAFVRDDEIGL